MIGGNWTALLTPFDKNGNIKTEQADALVSFYQKQRADGVYLLGYTGEGSVMNEAQRKEWAEPVVKAARGKLHAFVHVGYSSDPKVGIELAKHAALIGAEAVSSVGLSKETMLDENMAYFRAVSEASGLPFYVYWNAFGGNLNGGKRLDPKELIWTASSRSTRMWWFSPAWTRCAWPAGSWAPTVPSARCKPLPACTLP